jgi:putative DNA-binding protein
MTWPESPAWLLELQARFGRMLRTPLERHTGELSAAAGAYEPELVRVARGGRTTSAGQRLAVYNRQYWFRLFTLLQSRFPLTARLLGFWHFNQHAANFLSQHPPRSWDVDDVAAGFSDFLSQQPVDEAVMEAARIDAAYHDVFHAPPVTAHQFSAAETEHLPRARLRFSPARALLSEHWPLCALRQHGFTDEAPLQLEPRLDRARFWLLGRNELQVGLVALEPREAELLELLKHAQVASALAELEARCSPEERVELPVKAQSWLARSVRLDVWVGLELS